MLADLKWSGTWHLFGLADVPGGLRVPFKPAKQSNQINHARG